MVIDRLEAVVLGGTQQWIRVRGSDVANPVLLLIQQGPGLPIINEVRRFGRLLALEQAYTVIYWDQRGCGRSLRRREDRTDISFGRVVDDTVALLEFLRERFGRKVYVAGFSLGATVGAHAAARRPDLVATLVAVGMDIDSTASDSAAYDFALASASNLGNRRALGQLKAIGRPPHREIRQFTTRARWVTEFGGLATNENYGSFARRLLASLVSSGDYSPTDILHTLQGITATQAALLPETTGLDLVRTLPSIGVPMVMAQGSLDRVTSGEVAERYFDSLKAPRKQLVWFEHSAHMPHLEEPLKFRELLFGLRAEPDLKH